MIPEWYEEDVWSRPPPKGARFRLTWPLWWVAGIVLYRWRMWWRKIGAVRHTKPKTWLPGRLFDAVDQATSYRPGKAPIRQPIRRFLRYWTVTCVHSPIIGCDACGHDIDDDEDQFDCVDAGPAIGPDGEPWAYGWLWCDRCGRRNWHSD